MSDELLEASELISLAQDQPLTEQQKQRLRELAEQQPRVRQLEGVMEALRNIARSPEQINDNGVEKHKALPTTARARINGAVTAALESKLQPTASLANTSLASKQLSDVSFAMALLGEGRLSEDVLRSSIHDWTAHGNVSLAEHLGTSGVLSPAERAALETSASNALDDTLKSMRIENGKDSSPETNESMLNAARLLGLGHLTEQSESGRKLAAGNEYNLIYKLGQGGLGSVWLAHDEAFGRNVAVKEITPGKASESAIRRFKREAQITGKLDHPNIVSVYQFGSDEETGKTFYAMRFVGRRTLKDAISDYHAARAREEDTESQLNQLLAAFQTVCNALAFAHSRGVVHRDLKPQNVALDNFGQVNVIDWGLAKSLSSRELIDTQQVSSDELGQAERTVSGHVVGTPLYMAPEQAAGRIDLIDERTDIYGLGAILFEMLTGRPPHQPDEREDADRFSIDSILTEIVRNPTPQVNSVAPDVPRDLAIVCEKAMSKHKPHRHASAQELGDAVCDWVAGIAERTRRFELVRSVARDVEAKLVELADDLSRSARFIASLPPVQGMIDALKERDGCDTLEQWSQRFHSILLAYMRNDVEIAAVTFLRAEDATLREVVRVQRNRTDESYIRPIPSPRLTTWGSSDFLNNLETLDAGDVGFTVQEPLRARKRRKSREQLGSTIAIYDEITGELFGYLSIETDFSVINRTISNRLPEGVSVLVFDEDRRHWFNTITEFVSDQHASIDTLLSRHKQLENLGVRHPHIEVEPTLSARSVDFGDIEIGLSLSIVCIGK